MKALTVQQPWAWAIFAGKTVENRTQLWKYRGPLAIHAGARWSEHGLRSPLVHAAFAGSEHDSRERWTALESDMKRRLVLGAIIGVVDLVDCHRACGCCKPWGEPGISYAALGERHPRKVTHLVLENPRLLAEPIPCSGALGLWTPPVDVLRILDGDR